MELFSADHYEIRRAKKISSRTKNGVFFTAGSFLLCDGFTIFKTNVFLPMKT